MIFDQRDPSGMGLFSKVGRQMTSKIQILNQNKKNKGIVQSKAKLNKSCDDKQKQIIQKKGIQSQPFQKNLSRQKRNQCLEPKDKIPSVGQYNINMSTRPALVWDIMQIYQKVKNNQSTLRLKKQSIQSTHTEKYNSQKKNLDESIDSIKSQNKAKGFVEMSKMIGRDKNSMFNSIKPQQINLQNQVSIKKSIKLSKGNKSSKVKNILRFEQQLSRDRYQKQNISTVLCYDYDINKVKKSLGNSGPKFQKTLGRNYIKHNTVSDSIIYYDYDQYVWKRQSNIYKNTKLNVISYDRLKDRQITV